MIPHIQLQKGKRRYLLLRDETAFHVIEVDEALTKEKEALLLERLHTPEEMREMGLSGQTFPKDGIQGVAVYGYSRGDDFELHFGKKKQGWTLAKRYEPGYLDQLFRGIPRIPTPGKRLVKGGKNSDWRAREIDPAVRKQMRPVGIGVNVACVLCCIGLLFFHNRVPREWLLTAGFICVGFGLFLGVVHQEYFTFFDGKNYRDIGGKSKVSHLCGIPLLLLLLATTGFGWYFYFDQSQVIFVGAIFGLIVGLLGMMLIADFRNSIGHGILCVIVCIFLGAGIVSHFNHLLAGQEFLAETPVIVEMWVNHHSRASDDYICLLRFPDGRELRVDVGRSAYEEYEIGDHVEILVRTGALGIEYGILP